MSIVESNAAEIVPLEWDTQQFGFPVARLRAISLPPLRIESHIADAQRSGVEMLVVVVDSEQRLPGRLLARFSGLLADDKVTFVRSLANTDRAVVVESPARQRPADAITDGIVVEPFGGQVASAQLIELSIAAGEYSRFRVDPRFPRRAFEELYRLWIERSVRHELADFVLVARSQSRREPLLGMITVAVTDAIGSIGLIAVTEQSRGRGIGTRLIDAAHAAMCQRGAQSAYVVTQATNHPACRHYLRAGYALATTERIYHFWPQSTATR